MWASCAICRMIIKVTLTCVCVWMCVNMNHCGCGQLCACSSTESCSRHRMIYIYFIWIMPAGCTNCPFLTEWLHMQKEGDGVEVESGKEKNKPIQSNSFGVTSWETYALKQLFTLWACLDLKPRRSQACWRWGSDLPLWGVAQTHGLEELSCWAFQGLKARTRVLYLILTSAFRASSEWSILWCSDSKVVTWENVQVTIPDAL